LVSDIPTIKERKVKKHEKKRPFSSVSDRRKWVSIKLEAMVKTDPDYYKPLLIAGEEGKQNYIKAMGGKIGCQKPQQPTDAEMFSVLLDVSLQNRLDKKVLLHCDECFPCFLWLSRMLFHYVSDLGGNAWSKEVGELFPMLVKGFENEKWHLRLFLNSLKNGPQFSVYSLPFDKGSSPLIIGSSAGILGHGNYPLKDEVEKAQFDMQKMAVKTKDFTAKIDPEFIVQFAKKLKFNVDDEILNFFGKKEK